MNEGMNEGMNWKGCMSWVFSLAVDLMDTSCLQHDALFIVGGDGLLAGSEQCDGTLAQHPSFY